MRNIQIAEADAGQRLDKYLKRYLREASDGFIYKMLRKKNIKLNSVVVKGKEIIQQGDTITLYLSDETIDKFRGFTQSDNSVSKIKSLSEKINPLKQSEIIFENKDIIVLNKSYGELSQKARLDDVSINERLLAYLSEKDEWSPDALFTPGVCNRLDRNTTGILLAGKTLHGAQVLSELIKTRKVKKYYLALVEGEFFTKEKTIKAFKASNDGLEFSQRNASEKISNIHQEEFNSDCSEWICIDGYLSKDKKTNTVKIYDIPVDDASKIETAYRYLKPEITPNGQTASLIEIDLITGKTHQIRAHLSSIGHPLVGDVKYGGAPISDRGYYLHAYKVVIPSGTDLFEDVEKSYTFTCFHPDCRDPAAKAPESAHTCRNM